MFLRLTREGRIHTPTDSRTHITHNMLLFDPSLSALPMIETQKSRFITRHGRIFLELHQISGAVAWLTGRPAFPSSSTGIPTFSKRLRNTASASDTQWTDPTSEAQFSRNASNASKAQNAVVVSGSCAQEQQYLSHLCNCCVVDHSLWLVSCIARVPSPPSPSGPNTQDNFQSLWRVGNYGRNPPTLSAEWHRAHWRVPPCEVWHSEGLLVCDQRRLNFTRVDRGKAGKQQIVDVMSAMGDTFASIHQRRRQGATPGKNLEVVARAV